MSSSIQDLLEEVAASGVGLYELKSYSIIIKDSNGNEMSIADIKVSEDNKEVQIKVRD